MTARLTFQPDAAAHSAKNALAAPGSTIQPQDRTEESQMVATHEAPRTAVEQPVEDTTYTYTPHELDRLISREIAGRLREVADTLTSNADITGALFSRLALAGTYLGAVAARAQVYRDVASQLRHVAAFELETAGIACSWCGEAL